MRSFDGSVDLTAAPLLPGRDRRQGDPHAGLDGLVNVGVGFQSSDDGLRIQLRRR
jgi:hypothetical protein